MARPDFPRTILEFQARFGDEKACLDYMFDCRWPEGYVCPRCKGQSAWPVATRGLWECAACHYQVSLTAGNGAPQDTHGNASVVLGGLPDDDGDTGGLGAACNASSG
jgi:ribosomal protein L37AE/L43A